MKQLKKNSKVQSRNPHNSKTIIKTITIHSKKLTKVKKKLITKENQMSKQIQNYLFQVMNTKRKRKNKTLMIIKSLVTNHVVRSSVFKIILILKADRAHVKVIRQLKL